MPNSLARKLFEAVSEQKQREADDKADRQRHEDDLRDERLRLDKEKFDLDKKVREVQMKEIEARTSELQYKASIRDIAETQRAQMYKSLSEVDVNSPAMSRQMDKIHGAANYVSETEWKDASAPKYKANAIYLESKVKEATFKRAQDEAARIDKEAKDQGLKPSTMHSQTLPGDTTTYTNPKNDIKPLDRIKMQGQLAEADSSSAQIKGTYDAYVKKHNSDEAAATTKTPAQDFDTWLTNNPDHGKAFREAEAKHSGIKKQMELLPDVPVLPKQDAKPEVAQDDAMPPLVTDDPTKHIYSVPPKGKNVSDFPNAPVVTEDSEADSLPAGQLFILKKPDSAPRIAWKNPQYMVDRKSVV